MPVSLIISRSVARPLSAIATTIKRVAEDVEVPHTDRADEIGALARAIQIFQEAMDRNRNLDSQALLDSRSREERARHIGASVEAFRGANIGSLSDAIGDTNKAATSVLSASSALTSTAELLSREVDKFFGNLRAGSDGDDAARTGTTN